MKDMNQNILLVIFSLSLLISNNTKALLADTYSIIEFQENTHAVTTPIQSETFKDSSVQKRDWFLEWEITEELKSSIIRATLVFSDDDTDEETLFYTQSAYTGIDLLEDCLQTNPKSISFKPTTLKGKIFLNKPLDSENCKILIKKKDSDETADYYLFTYAESMPDPLIHHYSEKYRPSANYVRVSARATKVTTKKPHKTPSILVVTPLKSGEILPIIVQGNIGRPAILTTSLHDKFTWDFWKKSPYSTGLSQRKTPKEMSIAYKLPEKLYTQSQKDALRLYKPQQEANQPQDCEQYDYSSWPDLFLQLENKIRKSVDLFPVQQGSYSYWILETICEAYQNRELSQTQQILLDFCQEKRLSPQMLWFYSLYSSPSQQEIIPDEDETITETSTDHKSHHLLHKGHQKGWTPSREEYCVPYEFKRKTEESIATLKKILVSSTPTKKDRFEYQINLIQRLVDLLDEDELEKKELFLSAFHNACERAYQRHPDHSWDTRTLTDLTKYRINDLISEILMSPHIMSSHHMRVLRKIGNEWCVHLQKGLINIALRWNNEKLKKHMTRSPKKTLSTNAFQEYVNYIKEHFTPESVEVSIAQHLPSFKEKEFKSALRNATQPSKLLDELWNLLTNEFMEQFTPAHNYQEFISYIMTAIIHQEDSKLVESYIEKDRLKRHIKSTLQNTKEALPARFKFNPKYLVIANDYDHLIQQDCDKRNFLKFLLQNSIISYYFNLIDTTLTKLENNNIINSNNNLNSLNNALCDLKNIITTDLNPQRSFHLWISLLRRILNSLHQINQWFNHIDREFRLNPMLHMEILAASSQLFNQEMIINSAHFNSNHITDHLRDLQELLDNTYQILHNSKSKILEQSAMNPFAAFCDYISKNGQHSNFGHLHYILKFTKAAVDLKKRETFAEKREERYWPVDQQLAKKKHHSPVLAKVVITLPQKILGKLKSLSESIFWNKLQWPCQDWSWKGWERPVLEWSKPDIIHFINASGWLKLYDNFTHPFSLGREQKSNKGVETIPTCNSMVATPKTINHIQFLTEMAIALCIKTTKESFDNTTDDIRRHLQHIESIWQKLVADTPDSTGTCPITGKLKEHYNTTFDYKNHFHRLSRASHYQYEHSNKKQLYPSDIVKLLIDATVRQHQTKERLFKVVNSADSDAWRAVITNYFSNYDLNLVEAPHLRAFDLNDVTKPELVTFFSGYKLLRECFLAVATCDYVKNTTLHTFEENSFVVNVLSLPLIPEPEAEQPYFTWLASPTTLKPPQSRLTRWVIAPLKECRLPWHTLASTTKTALLSSRYNPMLFDLSSKLFADYVNATGTHLGHLITQAKNQHVPDTLDKQIEKLKRPESFKKLQKIYREYKENMSCPVKREKTLLKMKAVLSRGGLDYYWEKVANMARHTVDWSAEQDKIVLPVYLTWSILAGLYIQDGNLILDRVHQLETSTSDLTNSTRSAETIIALEAAAGINSTLPQVINNAGTFNPLASVTQWANQSHAIHNELRQISEENHGSFGADSNGIIRLNIGSTTLATVTGLIQSAGWFGDQLSIMEKTLRLEKLGLITGNLPALHCEHYLKMETGKKSIYKQGCRCQCRTNGQLSRQACLDSCSDNLNRVHDTVSCIASCPSRLTEACFGKCCDLNQSPCARNAASATAYCCCGGMCLSPFEAAIGSNPHQYMEAVIDRMVGAAGRSVGTGTRTVPYNTFKETLNTCVEDSNYAKFGRFAALFLDGVIAVGEISKFIVQSNAEEKHDSSSRAISKIYSPERFNAADLSCIRKFYGTPPACYLTRDQEITPIPCRSFDKTMSCLCCGLGSLGLGYSVHQAVLGIDNVFCKPLKKGIKAFNDSGWIAGRNAYDGQLKTVDIGDRTLKEKVPANSSIFCFSKSSRLAGSKRASHPGNNTQTALGNLKNGVTGPWNRTQIKSGDPAKMTFAGAVDAVEGFVVDAGNSQQSHLNMLNTPPPARQTGLKMVEASFYSALEQGKNPADQYLKIMKEKIGLCASGGLIQLAEFVDAHLMLEEQNLMKDWQDAKQHLSSHQTHHQFLAWQLKERTRGLIQIHHTPCRSENLHRINSSGDLEPLSITRTLTQTRADQAEIEKRISALSNINLRKRSALIEIFPLLLQLDQYKGGFMNYFMAQPAVEVLSGNTKPHQD